MIVLFTKPDCAGYSIQYTYEELMDKAKVLWDHAAKVYHHDPEQAAIYRAMSVRLIDKAMLLLKERMVM